MRGIGGRHIARERGAFVPYDLRREQAEKPSAVRFGARAGSPAPPTGSGPSLSRSLAGGSVAQSQQLRPLEAC